MNDAIINAGFFVAGLIVMLVFLLALGERRDNRNDAPAEPKPLPVPAPLPVVAVEPEPVAEPETVPTMTVIPPWPERAVEPEPVPVPVMWRDRLALESAPMFGGLPDHESVWRYEDWNLDDPDRTQMMRIIDGIHADELDVDLGEPQPLPGFEVSAADRRRLSLPEELIAEVTAALPSRKKAEVTA